MKYQIGEFYFILKIKTITLELYFPDNYYHKN